MCVDFLSASWSEEWWSFLPIFEGCIWHLLPVDYSSLHLSVYVVCYLFLFYGTIIQGFSASGCLFLTDLVTIPNPNLTFLSFLALDIIDLMLLLREHKLFFFQGYYSVGSSWVQNILSFVQLAAWRRHPTSNDGSSKVRSKLLEAL